MTNSRSRVSRSRLLGLVAAVAMVFGAGGARIAHADKRRVVVLDFEGPKGDRFHAELVKLIKKTHTVVSTEKWNGAAEQLDAGSTSPKDIKKVARKLKIDAVVEGRIEKRRDQFIMRLRLHDGKTGSTIGGSIDTKADGPKLDGKVERELKDELIGKIDSVDANGGGGGDDDDDKPITKPAKKSDDDDRPVKKAAKKSDDDDDKPAKHGFSKSHLDDERGGAKADKKKRGDDDAAEPPARKLVADEPAPRKPARRDDDDGDRKPAKKKVATRDEPVDEVEADPAVVRDSQFRLSPRERAVDVVAGMSLTARRLTFRSSTDLKMKPPGYKGILVAGAMVDATLYPLALGHSRSDRIKDIGLTVSLDRVLVIGSQNRSGTQFDTLESRYGVGGVFRYAFGRTAMSPVVLGTLGYASQIFRIANAGTISPDIPSVRYSIIEPGVGVRLPILPKLTVGLDAKFMLIPGTGQIQQPDQYGAARVYGFEGAFAIDYVLTTSVFARVAVRGETIGFNFRGTGTQSTSRDDDPMTQDVRGARDSYFGGFVTVGYLY
jgi:hypothetical protein